MLLSIIVPMYNTDSYLMRCFDSLFDQGLNENDFEIVVINDGSTDNSFAIVEMLATEHENILVFSQENQGVGAARNEGIRRANGKYIYFVDSDDYVASQSLAGLVDLMERYSLQVLGFDTLEVGLDEVPQPRARYDASQSIEVTSGMQFIMSTYHSNAAWWYIVSRELVLSSGLQFEAGVFMEDAVFTCRMLCAASRVAFVPADVYRWYVGRPGSITTVRSPNNIRRLIAGYERVVFGLQELRLELQRSGSAPTAVLERLAYRQQAYVFFLISRLIRADVPPKPLLPETLERLRSIDMYPLRQFPGRDNQGIQFTALTPIYNCEPLLYPFIDTYRWVRRLARALRQGKRG
jgi:glycosyltransferase involved in cell wall biosynthesis